MNYMIAPSVLSADFMNLGRDVGNLNKAQVDMIHYDVMDGNFVPEVSYGEGIMRAVKKNTDIPVDVHLMVVDPLKNIDSFAKAGADRITFHLEACENADEVIDRIHSFNIPAAVSVKPGTPVEAVFPYLDRVEMVLLMTVNPGFGGQPFLPESPERIKKLRTEIEARGLNVDIQVDGGINFETILTAKEAGANVFVSGSSLFRGDLPENVRIMRELL